MEEDRPHAVVGLDGDDLEGSLEQQPCQGTGTRSQVHDPLHAVRQQPIHCGDGRSGSKAIVVRSDLPEAAPIASPSHQPEGRKGERQVAAERVSAMANPNEC